MRFGTFSYNQARPWVTERQAFEELLDQIEMTERLGFHEAWFAEHHHSDYGMLASPNLIIAALARHTRRLRFGNLVNALPLHDPMRLAEECAMLDILTGGRLNIGLGRGVPRDDLKHGLDRNTAQARFEEGVEIVLRAWTEDTFTYRGTAWSYSDISCRPRPLQRPHPPLYLVGVSPETLAFGAARGLPLLLAGAQPVAEVKRTREAYRELLADAGHEPEDVRLPLNRFVYVAETAEQAIEETRAAVMGFIGRKGSVIRDFLSVPDGEITERLLHDEVFIFGDADRCLERIEELRGELDVRDLILTFNYFTIDHDRCRRSMERFTEQVLPELRRRPVGVGAGG